MGRKGLVYCVIAFFLMTTLAWAGYKVTGNLQVTGQSGTGTRYVVVDASGNQYAQTGVNWSSLVGGASSANWATTTPFLNSNTINWNNVNGLNPINKGGVNWLSISGYLNGNMLTAGTGGDVSFTTPTSVPVGYSLTSTTSMSSVSTSSNVSIDSTKQYLVKVILTSGSSANYGITFNGDTSGNHYQYRLYGISTSAGTTFTHLASTSANNILFFLSDFTPGTEAPSSITFNLDPQGTTSTKQYNVWGTSVSATQKMSTNIYGNWSNSATATYFNIITTVGSMSGTIYLYELKTS